ncbi:hypothetical protein DL96DRAFT_1614279 [Flagelloscypha sp. PMI_526]|nr:hypothetical protein DL96DRAFT_1614279 [Flagelloscypha sp. PMI_526]
MATYITSVLGHKVTEFQVSSSTEDTAITDVRPMASYNWVEAKTPTIIVPGTPPIWTNARITRVRQDRGKTFIDQNAARMRAASPLEPLFVAVEEMGEHDVLKQHRFISDRNNLRKLFKWVNTKQGHKTEDFRIDVDLAGSTCLLTRVEKNATAFVNSFQGYGHEYEKVATKWPAWCKGATAHHRIISLNLGGIPIILRFEVDGQILSSENDSNGLSQATKNLNISQSAAPIELRGIKVKRSTNSLTPQSSLLEIKTRSATTPVNLSDVYPQIFLSQTEFLYVARHNNGLFGPVKKHSLAGDTLSRYAEVTKASLVKLKDLLESIHAAAVAQGGQTGLTLACVQGKLGLYRRKGGKSISGEVLKWFDL